ncbi:MAG: hypothetical protein L3J82_05900 [Planctomycetes bacterium]|nr:hypothetical protein [Planctomycetota bacterium]
MKLSKGFLFVLLLLLCAGSVLAYGYWLNREIPEVCEKDREYEEFLISEFERLEGADPENLTATEKELVANMGDDWESLETAAIELIYERHSVANKLAAESVGEYDWQHEPKGSNGWVHLEKAQEILSEDISFRVSDEFWDGSKLVTEANRKELLDSWTRAEPHLKQIAKADFIRSPQNEFGMFQSVRFYSVVKRAVICDFIELDSDKVDKFPRLEFVQSLQTKNNSPVNALDALIHSVRMMTLRQAIRGGAKQGFIDHSQLEELDKLFNSAPSLIETMDGEFWTAARISVLAKDSKWIYRVFYLMFDNVPKNIGTWVDVQTNETKGNSRANQMAAVNWLKKNKGDLTDPVYANKFRQQEFTNDKIIEMFSGILEHGINAKISQASIHLYFDKDGQPPETLPEIPMTICKVEDGEIVFYWDSTHPMVSEHSKEFPEIIRIK